MSAALIIYLADVLGSIKGVFVIAGILGTIFSIVPLFVLLLEGYFFEEEYKPRKKILIISTWLFSTMLIVGTLIPSEKTIYMMASAKVAEDIVKSPETKELGNKILQLINQKLDEQLEKK